MGSDRFGSRSGPFWPLGGFRPLQLKVLEDVAADLGASARQIALAWLLHRSPTICLIPATSTREHLAQNIEAAGIRLPAAALGALDEPVPVIRPAEEHRPTWRRPGHPPEGESGDDGVVGGYPHSGVRSDSAHGRGRPMVAGR
ncbi:aldo/keto reductase [Streptomyces hyaluromycini]|uniref:Aldo/keto reductase n=1 Tax=Streptomyces hyaluromycini TaxID=1377993 RepID=A0ABV1X657_9ACTN